MVKKYADLARNFTELWFSSYKYMKTKHFGTRNNAKHLEKKKGEREIGKKEYIVRVQNRADDEHFSINAGKSKCNTWIL